MPRPNASAKSPLLASSEIAVHCAHGSCDVPADDQDRSHFGQSPPQARQNGSQQTKAADPQQHSSRADRTNSVKADQVCMFHPKIFSHLARQRSNDRNHQDHLCDYHTGRGEEEAQRTKRTGARQSAGAAAHAQRARNPALMSSTQRRWSCLAPGPRWATTAPTKSADGDSYEQSLVIRAHHRVQKRRPPLAIPSVEGRTTFGLRKCAFARDSQLPAQPVVPVAHALSGASREPKHRRPWVNSLQVGRGAREIEIQMGQQVDFVDDDQ
jgi:hypothetical protein